MLVEHRPESVPEGMPADHFADNSGPLQSRADALLEHHVRRDRGLAIPEGRRENKVIVPVIGSNLAPGLEFGDYQWMERHRFFARLRFAFSNHISINRVPHVCLSDPRVYRPRLLNPGNLQELLFPVHPAEVWGATDFQFEDCRSRRLATWP